MPSRAYRSHRERHADTANAVMVASRALVGVAARSLGALDPDVTLGQYRALVLLAARGEQNVGTLAEALAVHASTATRLCDRLIAKGLIERATSSESRREVSVRLSRAGHAVVRGVTARRRREIERIVDAVPAGLQRTLIDAFEAFSDAAGELPDDAWKLGWAP
jgi:DNA-binding MarR family transcriptional regulator